MSSIEIEFSPDVVSQPCECCGGVTTTLNRFVTVDGQSSAVYRVVFSDNHPDAAVLGLIGIGAFGEGTSETQRVAFALSLRPEGVMVIDADEAQWPSTALLGRKLSREDAMARAELPLLYRIVDGMYERDQPLRTFLRGVAGV